MLWWDGFLHGVDADYEWMVTGAVANTTQATGLGLAKKKTQKKKNDFGAQKLEVRKKKSILGGSKVRVFFLIP